MSNLIAKWSRSWTFYHVLLWVGIVISLAVDSLELAMYDFSKYISLIVVRNGLLIALTYINLFLLIPRYYRKNRRLAYWVLLLLSITVFVLLYNNFLFNFLRVFLRGKYENMVFFQVVSNFFTACRYLLLSLLLRFMQDWFDQEKKLNQIAIDKLSAELNYLRVQINPHFLFNTLNNLYGLALKKSDLAPRMIMKLSDIMEYMLLESSSKKVVLEKEIDNIQNYIELEKIRQTYSNLIHFEVNGNPATKTIEPFLLFPFFENAFKHGINSNRKNGYLAARLEIRSNEMLFTIENSKPSDPTPQSTGHGIGLTNLKKRLSLLYPNRHHLEITDSRENFLVSLTLKDEI